MSTLLQRYLAGEHEQVWNELTAHGERIREEPLHSEALAVARATMARARHNVELLRERLVQIGYRFAYPDEVIIAPTPDVEEQIGALERRVGPLPLSLRAWYEVVGSVNFIGAHPEWQPCEHCDPLVVDPLSFALEEYREWKESAAEYGRDAIAPYSLPIAPDEYHKAEVSGSPQFRVVIYNVALPSPLADAPIGEEPHHTSFVNYLRISFRWGGFPGFEFASRRPEQHLEVLTRDLQAL